jgi:chromosome partitioning protein
MRFLDSLRIPVAAVLRDSQAYVRSAECGMGLHEMKGSLLQEDLDTWRPLVEWLEGRTMPAAAFEPLSVAVAGEGAERVDACTPTLSC